MTTNNPLFRSTDTIENGAAVRATKEGGLALITPLTSAVDAWLHEHVGPDASWSGDSVVVELRYFPALADALIEAGFRFERDALPN